MGEAISMPKRLRTRETSSRETSCLIRSIRLAPQRLPHDTPPIQPSILHVGAGDLPGGGDATGDLRPGRGQVETLRRSNRGKAESQGERSELLLFDLRKQLQAPAHAPSSTTMRLAP